ncbi:MAG: acyltransferase [Candidatus Omnitrophica bacterium]|nr:acyltransferase [Candidatus Omnitrophota bacterium]
MMFIRQVDRILGGLYCKARGVTCPASVNVYGFPIIKKDKAASITLADGVTLTSRKTINLAGIAHPVILAAPYPRSHIAIGRNSGMSGGVLYAVKSIVIGKHVNIGVNTCVYDTDFHPLDFKLRRGNDPRDAVCAPVTIEDDVWIGGGCLILKGVMVGTGAVIGARSVITKDIPPFTLWAGNPARLIKEIHPSK